MEQAQPPTLVRREVNRLLSKVKHADCVTERIEVLSGVLLGRPYEPNPLIGSADETEVFTVSLDGFDCVTYIETILALALASHVDEFMYWLRQIRYEQGCVRWDQRNHYITNWIQNNVRQGIIRPVSTAGVPVISRQRVLNAVADLAPLPARVICIPKTAAQRLSQPHLHTGDLIFFVSTRKNLDVFHAGISVRDGEKVRMRHASRSQGMVVEQHLDEFLATNRMAGIIVERPQKTTRARGVAGGRRGIG